MKLDIGNNALETSYIDKENFQIKIRVHNWLWINRRSVNSSNLLFSFFIVYYIHELRRCFRFNIRELPTGDGEVELY